MTTVQVPLFDAEAQRRRDYIIHRFAQIIADYMSLISVLICDNLWIIRNIFKIVRQK